MPRKSRKQVRKIRYANCFILLVLVIVGILLLRILLQKSIWHGDDRFVLMQRKSENLAIKIFEPQSTSVYSLTIPGNTQLESVHSLGKWRLSSLWKLYGDEDLGAGAVADTLVYSTSLPIDGWVGNCSNVLLCRDTNLSLKDRVKLFLFEIKLSQSQRIEIDPYKYKLLRKSTFVDGEEGYVVVDRLPNAIVRLFSSENVIAEQARVAYKNYSENGDVDRINKVVESLGARLVSIDNGEGVDTDCLVKFRGDEYKITAEMLGNIFGCSVKKENLNNFDVIIETGSKFWERF